MNTRKLSLTLLSIKDYDDRKYQCLINFHNMQTFLAIVNPLKPLFIN